MDPISNLSLVANVFEVISFASDLVSAGNKIYHSRNGALDKNATAEELANDLRKLSTGLSESQASWVNAHGGSQLNADEIRLRNICERCNETAVELNLHLQKLKVQDGAKFRRLKAYRQAIISVWREDEVDKVASRLDKYQRELDTHILVGLRKSAQEADLRSNAQFTTMDQRTQETILAVLEIDKKLDTRLDDHADLLGRVYENTNQLLTIRRTPSTVPPYEGIVGKGPRATPLHTAAAAGDLLKVKKALRSWGVDVNARDEDGCAPLHLAKTADVARRLIAQDGLRLNAEENEGRSPLHCAVLNRRLWVIKTLLEAGVDQSLEDDYGRTAAFYAQDCNASRWMLKYGPETEAISPDHLNNTGLFQMAWLGDLEGTQFFIDQGADVNARNKFSETALTEASRHGSLEVVRLLLCNGAKVEVATAGNGWTPLCQAVRDNRVEVIRVLLDHGANKHARLKSGCDAVAEACFRGHHEVARILMEHGARLESLNHYRRTPLLEASRRNDGAWTQWLLRRGAKNNVRDADGRSPVWHAANGGHYRSLAALLGYNSPTETLSNDSWLPLGSAASSGHLVCVRLLLNARADMDVHQAHGSGYTALCEACHHGHVDVVKLFIERGANMEIGSKSGFSALSVAAVQGQDAVVRVLAEAGADLDKPGFTNMDSELSVTPLMRAITAGHTSTALLLIELGADVAMRCADGKTALIYAAEKSNASVTAALLAKGADVNSQSTKRQETALMSAATRGSVDVALVLLEARANTRLRDWRGCTAWIMAKQTKHGRQMEALLGPTHAADETEMLTKLREGASVAEIARYMNEMYR